MLAQKQSHSGSRLIAELDPNGRTLFSSSDSLSSTATAHICMQVFLHIQKLVATHTITMDNGQLNNKINSILLINALSLTLYLFPWSQWERKKNQCHYIVFLAHLHPISLILSIFSSPTLASPEPRPFTIDHFGTKNGLSPQRR